MGYRDELETLRARVARLEQDLEQARRELQAANRPGAFSPSGEGASGGWATVAGGPLALREELTFDGELADSANEDILDALRRRFGVLGQVTNVGRTFSWTSFGHSPRIVEVSVTRRRGKTTVRLVERMQVLAGGLYGGVLGGVGGGGLGLVIPLAIALELTSAIPLFILGWLLVVFAIVRSIYSSAARRRERELTTTTAELGEIIEDALRAPDGARVRVDAPSSPSADEDARDEAAEEETEPRSVDRERRRAP